MLLVLLLIALVLLLLLLLLLTRLVRGPGWCSQRSVRVWDLSGLCTYVSTGCCSLQLF
jgi:hypothetical protein